MLTEERYASIMQTLDKHKTATVSQLADNLHVSESTIRRDLIALDRMGKLCKVHGGATINNNNSYLTLEEDVLTKQDLHNQEKALIAKYAATLIGPEDFVYLDAGTTTASMLPYLEEKKAVYVTNSLEIAMNLTKRGLTTYMIAGKIRQITEAMVGCEAEKSIQNYHFTKGFFGTNGISLDAGYSTPNIEEAQIKRMAMQHSYDAYILADYSKFSVNSSVTFGNLEDAIIITDRLTDKIYKESTTVIEV